MSRAEYMRAYYAANKERIKAASAKRRAEKPDECRAVVAEWHKANADIRREYMRDVASKSAAFKSAQRRRSCALRLQAPAWLTANDRDCMKAVRELAAIYSQALGEQFEVDHIVPLQGETVCGLHVPSNLQVLRATESRCKSNSFAQGEHHGYL